MLQLLSLFCPASTLWFYKPQMQDFLPLIPQGYPVSGESFQASCAVFPPSYSIFAPAFPPKYFSRIFRNIFKRNKRKTPKNQQFFEVSEEAQTGFEPVSTGVADVSHYFFKPLFYHGFSRLPPHVTTLSPPYCEKATLSLNYKKIITFSPA